jgi:hypothetical protein
LCWREHPTGDGRPPNRNELHRAAGARPPEVQPQLAVGDHAGHLLERGLGLLGQEQARLSERQLAGEARVSMARVGRTASRTAHAAWSPGEHDGGQEPRNEYSGDDRDHCRQWGDPGRFNRMNARPGAVPAESIHCEQQACGPTDDARQDVGNHRAEVGRSPRWCLHSGHGAFRRFWRQHPISV